MPPRIPAANELIADKRCYVWHGVLPTTSSHTRCPLPPLAGPDLEHTRRGSSPSWSPQREGKEGACLLRARDSVWPARPLSLPEQPRQRLALVTHSENSREREGYLQHQSHV